MMSIQVSRILHAGYLIQTPKNRIVFDPIFENPFSQNCFAFPDVSFDLEKIKNLKIDAIFISHFHDDHCSLESLAYLNRETPLYMYCLFPELFEMIRMLGFQNVYSIELNQKIVIGDIEVTARRALDSDVDCLFQIQYGKINILNVVDSWIDQDTLSLLKKQGDWDLVMWPFQTMRELEVLEPSRSGPSDGRLPIEWKQQLLVLNPRAIVASSCQFRFEDWSWYNHCFFPISYTEFASQVHEWLPQSQVIRLDPGQSLNVRKGEILRAAGLDGIKPVGSQEVDYIYDPSQKPQPIAEIASRFSSLNDTDFQRVDHFCRFEMIEKFNSLNLDLQDLQWDLFLYDSQRGKTRYCYEIQNRKIKLSDLPEASFQWVTEVPAYKLWRALNCGESMTSMYLRVHKIVDEDVMKDPLINCLFTEGFGSYQRAQLIRLKILDSIEKFPLSNNR